MSIESIKSVLIAVVNKTHSEILLVKRKDVPVWVLPGGGVDPGESLEEAALREAKEEIGCEVELIRAAATYYPGGPFIKPVRLFLAKLKNAEQILENAPSSETSQAAFFSLDTLPREIPPPFDEFIRDAFANQSYFERTIKSITPWFVIKNILLHPILSTRFLLSRIGLHINTHDPN